MIAGWGTRPAASARLLSEPGRQLTKSIVEPMLGTPPQSLLRLPYIEYTAQELAGAGRRELDRHPAAERSHDRFAELEDAALLRGRDVEGRVIDAFASRHRRAPREHVGAGHIPDEHVVARLAPVAEHRERPAGQHPRNEDRHHAGLGLGVLAGPEDVGVAHGHALEAVEQAEGPQVVLARELAHAVGGHGALAVGFRR